MVQALQRHELSIRSHFSGTFLPISRSRTTLSRKEHFYAARESLLGLWQTDNRSEHLVLMVRTVEEVVLGSPRAGIESRIACYDGVLCPKRARPSTLTCRRGGRAAFGRPTRAHCLAGRNHPESPESENRQFLPLKRSPCYPSHSRGLNPRHSSDAGGGGSMIIRGLETFNAEPERRADFFV
jgi:hypothetical protein